MEAKHEQSFPLLYHKAKEWNPKSKNQSQSNKRKASVRNRNQILDLDQTVLGQMQLT